MDDAPESRAGAVALMVLGVVIALACASAIGAVATLVVMTLDKPASVATTPLASNECVVVVWKTGMIYCLGHKSDEGNKPMRNGPAVVVQAQAEESAR